MPYAPHEDAPTLKIWIASGENATSTGTSGAGSGSASPCPGVATKKSSRWLRPVGEVSSMNPPAPGPREQRLGRERHQHRPHRGVHRVATRAQDVRTRLGGDRMPCCDDAPHAGARLSGRAAPEQPAVGGCVERRCALRRAGPGHRRVTPRVYGTRGCDTVTARPYPASRFAGARRGRREPSAPWHELRHVEVVQPGPHALARRRPPRDPGLVVGVRAVPGRSRSRRGADVSP